MEMTKYKLGDIAKTGSGGTPKSTVAEYYENGNIPWINSGELNNPFISTTSNFITQKGYDNSSAKLFPPQTVLLAMYGATAGKASLLEFEACTNQAICAIMPNQDILLPRFLKYKLDTMYNYLVGLSTGSARDNLSQDGIKALELCIPPLSEQKKIASVLSALDDKIALNKKMNQKLEAMAKRLYDYWFVQYDFPDKNGHPYKTTGGPMTYNPTLKREIPVGWEVKTLDEYLDCNKYSLTAKSSYDFIQYLDTSSLTENTLESLQRYGSQAESPSRAKRIVYANDILYSTVRPQQKHYGIIKNPAQNMIASTGFAILSCKYGSEYNDMFYLFLIQEKNLIKLSAIADSNASSYPSFNPSDLLNLSICLPEDIKTIEPLVKKFSSLFGIIERNQKENQKLTALRDKLLPLLMNGQVVVE